MKNLHMGEASAPPRVRELVINWHITEACNFSCRYCYAKWDGTEKELIHDWGRTQKLLSEIAHFLHLATCRIHFSRHSRGLLYA